MNKDQKLLLYGGGIILVLSAVNLATTGVPREPASAVLFPLSILGVFFGTVFMAWSAVWMALQETKVLK